MNATEADRRFNVLGGLFAALMVGAVVALQPGLAKQAHTIKETDDIYPFPPPPILRLATLGYVSATTDVLWGKLLVENGIHWSERRQFPDVELYLDAIVGLEPTFHPLYEYVDSLLCYRPMNGHELEARETRAYLEKGLEVLPNDAEVWKRYGQFVAFMGPTYLTSDAEKKVWKHDGAIALQHAVELGGDMQLGIAGSAVLDSRLGEREAAIPFLERAYALAEDEATRKDIVARLEMMHAGQAADCARDAAKFVEGGWRKDYPFLSRGTYLMVAPYAPSFRCVGPGSEREPGCASDWEAARPVCR